jgi:hypothetical protein
VGLLTVLCFVDTEYALTYHGPKYIAFAIADASRFLWKLLPDVALQAIV